MPKKKKAPETEAIKDDVREEIRQFAASCLGLADAALEIARVNGKNGSKIRKQANKVLKLLQKR